VRLQTSVYNVFERNTKTTCLYFIAAHYMHFLVDSKTNKSGGSNVCKDGHILNVQYWALTEMNVPPYP